MFVSFSDLLKISWDNVKRNFKNIILLMLVAIGIGVGLIVITGVLGIAAIGSQLPVIKAAIDGGSWQSLMSVFSPEIILGLVVGFLMVMIVTAIFGLLMQITQIKILALPKTNRFGSI